MKHHDAKCYLVNTGWSGGKYGVGSRMKLAWSRAIIDAIHNGELANATYENFDTFNLSVPTSVTGVPTQVLNPVNSWEDKVEFKSTVTNLANLFVSNFHNYEDAAGPITSAGPSL
eukprot:Awhi_evm1s12105